MALKGRIIDESLNSKALNWYILVIANTLLSIDERTVKCYYNNLVNQWI